jgi:nucleoside permease NupC
MIVQKNITIDELIQKIKILKTEIQTISERLAWVIGVARYLYYSTDNNSIVLNIEELTAIQAMLNELNNKALKIGDILVVDANANQEQI